MCEHLTEYLTHKISGFSSGVLPFLKLGIVSAYKVCDSLLPHQPEIPGLSDLPTVQENVRALPFRAVL